MARAPVRTARTVAAETAVKKEKSELDIVTAEFHKRFGSQSIIVASEQRQPWRIPSGAFMLDLATCGGIPHNQLSMFHGPRSCGKTTTAEKVIAGAQASLPNQRCAFVDLEHTRDAVWGGKLGVDNDSLLYVNPETGEHAVDMVDALIRTKEISLIVLDSIAAMVPNKEVEDSAEDAHVGLQSKLISRMCRKITNGLFVERMRGHYVTLLVINQQRTKIGGWSPTGEAIGLPGGKQLEFTTAFQCQFKNKENVKKDKDGFDTLAYNEHSFRIDKCKMNGGIRTGEFQLMRRDSEEYPLYEGDFDDAEIMLAHAKKIGLYTGAGRAQTLAFGDYQQTFGNVAEAVGALYEDRNVMWQLRNHLIADHARRLKMPTDFIKYILGEK